MDDGLYEKALAAALRALRTRERLAGELKSRLLAKGFPEPIAEQVIGFLVSKGLLNDARALENLSEKAARTGGRHRLRATLRERGADEVAIEAAASQFTPEAELESAKTLLAKRLRVKALSRDQAARWLASRGFGSEIVREALSQAFQDPDS